MREKKLAALAVRDVTYKRVGLLGGTFDPIHNGHIEIAKLARDLLDLDIVYLVVANDPYQKSDKQEISNAWARYRVAKAAVAGEPKIKVSTIELDRKGKSYSIDTVLELKSKHSYAEIFMIIGSDIVENLNTWEKFEELGQLVTLVVFDRKSASQKARQPSISSDFFPNQIYLGQEIVNTIPQISSSGLKELIVNNHNIDEFLNIKTIRALEVEKLYNKINEEFNN